jgi:uncharacterized RDD family membrane protein YckC
MSDPIYSECPPASLIKQLAAMLYDSLLIFAVLFFASAIALIFNQGEAISGQTLGMRVWKIRIVAESGANPGWGVSYLRLLFALLSLLCFGLGYLWRLFKPYTWHDRLSHTRIVDISSLTAPKKQDGTDAQ